MYLSGTKYCSLLLGCLLSLSLQAKDKKTIEVGQSLSKPFTFIENNGQITGRNNKPNTDIQYKLSTPGMNLLVGKGHLYYQFRKVEGSTDDPTIVTHNMEVTLLGANAHATAISSEPQEYFENYFIDGLSRDGITAHSFNKVIYKNIYRNIDWVIYVKNNKVEYDFVVRPGGNVHDIQLQYGGADALALTKDGGLSAETSMGKVEEQKPFSYDETGKEIASAFALHNNIVSFEAAPHKGTLTIDPYILWSTYLGKTGEDVVTSVTVSNVSQIYVTGYTSSAVGLNFGGGIWDGSYNGGTYDAFAAKYNNAGSLQWCTYFGGNNLDRGTGIALDNTGTYVYVSGSSTSTPAAGAMASFGAFRTTNAGGSDAFLAKFTTAGGGRIWATFWGGTGDDYANSVAVDAANNVYITGQTASNGVATAGKYQTVRHGTTDAFIAKFNGSTSTFGSQIWATYYGGTAQETAYGIAVDPSTADLIVTGQTNSVTDIASGSAYQSTLSGTNDAFIARIDSAGASRMWGTYYGGPGQEQGNGAACDAVTGNIAIVGNTTSASGIATANAFNTSYGGGPQDAFVGYFDGAGNIKWGTYYGGTQPDYGESVTMDLSGNILVAGGTFSSTGIASPVGTFAVGGFQPALGGNYDAYVGKFNSLGQMLWGTYFGAALYDYANAIAFDRTNEQIVLGGYTTSTAGIATAGVTQTLYGGGTYDGFVTKLKKDTILQIVQPYIDTLVCQNGVLSVAFSSNVTGYQAGNVFTLEMSDAAGGFGSPTTLGTLAATTGSGTIAGTIPAAASGTGYRIRIKSSNPVYISPDNYLNIQVVPSIAPATATANTPVCAGNDLTLSASAPYTIASYSWTGPGTITGASGTPAHVLGVSTGNAGTYSVTTTHNGCPATTSTVSVTVNTAHPPTPIATTTAPACAGSSISLFGNPDTTATGITYFWSGPAGFTSTMQNPTISTASTANSGTYYLTDTMAGCQSTTASVVVNVLPVSPASVSITVSPNDTVCQGTMVSFVATPSNGGATPTYQWMSGAGTPIVGAISNTFSSSTLTDGETVFVMMSSSVTCPFPAHASSNVVTMNVISNPPVVYITASPGTSVVPGTNVTLSSIVYNGGTDPSYQWMLNGHKIAGATSSVYTLNNVRTSDNISLIVKSNMNCATPDSGISNALVIRPNTGVSKLPSALDAVVLYPNPNNGSFMLKGDVTSDATSVDVTVANLLGQVVYADKVKVINGSVDAALSVQQLPAGVYLMRMSDGATSKTIRFTVQY